MKHRVRPEKGDFETARELSVETLRECQEELPKQEEVTLGLGWTTDEFVIQKMNGASGKSFGPGRIFISFNSKAENWMKALKALIAHEYAHTWWYEKRNGFDSEKWEYVIDEAFTQLFEERIVPDFDTDKKEKFSREEVAEYWPKIKEKELDKDAQMSDPLYVSKYADEDLGFPNWLGYSLSYYLGKKLLEDHQLEEFKNLERKDLVETGNAIFE